MSENKKDKIFALRKAGYSYDKIVKETGYSKSLICYYCGEGVKSKALNRQRKTRSSNPLRDKCYTFLRSVKSCCNKENSKRKINEFLVNKIRHFFRDRSDEKGKYKIMFTTQELKDKIGDNPTCYLTGRPIDLSKSRTYELDHIIPSSRGGDNSLENCGLACREANRAKADMTLEEFKSLCQEVVNHTKLVESGNDPALLDNESN